MKRTLRTAALAGAALVLAGGAAMAASATLHKMNVSLPDGTVAQIEYAGDVAPHVTLQPVSEDAAMQGDDAFADFDRLSAMMDRQEQAMMQQVAAIQAAAAHGAQTGAPQPGMVTVSTNMPKGSYRYEFVSTTSGNGTCAQTVSWSSDGSSAQPNMTQTSSGDCDTAKSGKPTTVQVTAPAPAQQPAPAGTNKV
jgi:hypothetical protein